MSKEVKREVLFANKLINAISEVIRDEDNENYIELNEDNITDFMYALSCLMPTTIYQGITREDKNALEFNHLANQLCFQYGKSVNSENE